MRYACIARHRGEYPVRLMCRVLAVSPSGFYAAQRRRPSARAQRDQALRLQVLAVHKKSRRTYGAPRVHAELRTQGEPVAKKRVARLMREDGLVGRRPRRRVRTTDSQHGQPVAPNVLQRRFKVDQVPGPDRVRGIGVNSAWLYVMEFFGWRQFRNRREVGGLAGLTPTPYQSGAVSREQGIGKAGNRYIRAMAIEIAWGWLRFQPESALSRWYQERFGQGSSRIRRIGIVALARRLLVELWRYLETGAVPEGVVLTA